MIYDQDDNHDRMLLKLCHIKLFWVDLVHVGKSSARHIAWGELKPILAFVPWQCDFEAPKQEIRIVTFLSAGNKVLGFLSFGLAILVNIAPL